MSTGHVGSRATRPAELSPYFIMAYSDLRAYSKAQLAPAAAQKASTPPAAASKVDALQRFLWGALIVSLPFTAMSLWPAKLKTFGQPTVFLIALLTALSLGSAVLPKGWFFIPRGRSVYLLAAFLAVVTLSFFVSYPVNPYMWPGHNPWTKSAKQLLQWLVDGAMVYLTLRFIQTWRDFRFALRCYFIGFLCVVGSAILNVAAIRWPSGRAASLFYLLHNGAFSGATDRLSLLAYEPSFAGDYLISVVPLLICGVFYWKSRRWTLFWSAVAILLFCAALSFGSFGALVAACFIVAVVYARRGSKGLLIGCTALGLVLVAAMFSSSKGQRFLGGRISEVFESGSDWRDVSNFSTRQRLASAEAAFKIFLNHPWTGVGVGKSPFYMYRSYPVWGLQQADVYGSTFGSYDPSGAICFNLFIQTLAEVGIVGGLLFFIMLISIMADCYSALGGAEVRWKSKVFAGVLMAVVAQVIHYNAISMLDFRYWFFILGLAMCAPRLLKQRDPRMPAVRVIRTNLHGALAPRRVGQSARIPTVP